MTYKTDEFREFETQVEKYTRLGKLVDDLRIVRSMYFNQVRRNTLSITIDIVSPDSSFDNFGDASEINSLMKLPTTWRTDVWDFIISRYTTDILDLAELLGLKWDEDYILNKLTKT